jgi:hypothetical protein
MRTVFTGLALLLALGLYGYLAIGWGVTIWQQGFEAAITEHTTQPSLVATVGGLVLGTVFLCIGLGRFGRGRSG